MFNPTPLRLPALFLALTAAGFSPAAPSVVTSIAPVHAIVADVMEGVGEPLSLVPADRTPHHYSLRPSEARELSRADMVVWVGPELETFLARTLESLTDDARVLQLTAEPGIVLLPYRDDHGHDDVHHDDHGREGAADPHIWMSFDNARAIAAAVAAGLSALDVANAERYADNAARAAREYAELGAEIAERLRPYAGVPFMVFHDAYQYFERETGLTNVGAVTVRADISPGIERMSELRRTVREAKVRCIFGEPQFPARILDAVAEGSGARVARIDPLGAGIEPGPGAYARLMRAFAADIAGCLGEG